MAPPPGFEPKGFPESKSGVLPLHQGGIIMAPVAGFEPAMH